MRVGKPAVTAETPVCSLAMCCRAPSIPEAQDMSRSSSNASSFASVVEENEGEEEYDTGQVGGYPQMHLFTSQCKNAYFDQQTASESHCEAKFSLFKFVLCCLL